MKKKRLVLTNLKMNGLSWYRLQGVFKYVAEAVSNLEITFTDDKDTWHTIFQNDIYYIPRPNGQQYLQNIATLKGLKKTVVIDWDDDFMSLPKHHPSYRHFNNPQTIKANIESIKMADVVTVSTQYLKDLLSPYNENVILIRNAFNDNMFSFKKNPQRTSDIYWRGSQFHRGDIFSFIDEMSELIAKNSVKWVFNGSDDFWPLLIKIPEHSGKIHHQPPADVIQYMYFLSKYNPLLVHIPLEDNKFNKSKSNIGLIEACLAGTIPVCPNWEEWRLDGALNYDNPKEYFDLISNVIKGEIDVEKQYNQLVESIKDSLILSKENQKRIELFKNL